MSVGIGKLGSSVANTRALVTSGFAALANTVLSMFTLFVSLQAFDALVTHYDPAMPLPQWRALPVIGPAYFLLGLVAGLWSSKWWTVVIPGAVGFLWEVSNIRTAVDYHPISIWDHLGRPTVEGVSLAFICSVFMGVGWLATRSLSRNTRSRARA